MNTNQEEPTVEVTDEVLCCCYEIAGDNDKCDIHGHLYHAPS